VSLCLPHGSGVSSVGSCPGLPIWGRSWITAKCRPIWDVTPCSPIEVRAMLAPCCLLDVTSETGGETFLRNIGGPLLDCRRQLFIVTAVTIPDPTILLSFGSRVQLRLLLCAEVTSICSHIGIYIESTAKQCSCHCPPRRRLERKK
jgi:hypothetical protein